MGGIWGQHVHALQGRRVCVALAGQRRIDDATLESVRDDCLWLYTNGSEVVVPAGEIVDLWEVRPGAQRVGGLRYEPTRPGRRRSALSR